MKKLYTIFSLLLFCNFNLFAQDPCTSISTITCGTNVTFTQTGTGNVNYPNNFGSCTSLTAQGGKEQIYQFIPTTTGTYEFDVTTSTGGYVQYLWKLASLGCNNTGWNCIDRITTTGSVGAVNFTAGTSYYIILNAESTATTTNIFTLKCATNICNTILPITCDTSTNFTKTGYGEPTYPNNFGSCTSLTAQGGKEQIYQFTPTTTGTYEFDVTTSTGGYVQYLWKLASLGCNNTGWNCIDRTTTTGSVGAVNFTAGTSYYIILNAESTATTTNIFTLKCATNICNTILTLTCGTPTNFSKIGYGDPNYANNFGSCTSLTSQGGKEQIYTLPASSSTYQINITNATGGYVQYLWKLQSSGCTNTGWTCLGRKNSTGIITNTIPASTTPIYLMLNSESSATVNHTFQVSCSSLATDEFVNDNKLSIFPNPTNSILNIHTPNETKIENIVITDLMGKIIYEKKSNQNQINIESLSNGIYFIKVFSDNKYYESKFLKE